MKNIIKLIFIVCITLLGLYSCEPMNCDEINSKQSPKEVADSLALNKAEELKVKWVDIQLVEGHSHAKASDRTKIGGVMWETGFVSGAFHGNPFSEDIKLPLKRQQYLTYERQDDGSYKNTYKVNDIESLQILSTTPRKNYVNGCVNALIVRLYDENDKRIDLELKSDSLKNRVQVFYQVMNVQPLFPDYSLPEKYDKKDICYYWYYDRKPFLKNNELKEFGDFIKDEAVGLRGVIQCLEPKTKFVLRMSITILPKGMEKEGTLRNSISPSELQAKHVVFQFDIPISVVAEFPNFSGKATDVTEEKFGKSFYDFNDDEANEFERLSDKFENDFYEDLHKFYSSYSVEDIKKFIREQQLLLGESSNFYL